MSYYVCMLFTCSMLLSLAACVPPPIPDTPSVQCGGCCGCQATGATPHNVPHHSASYYQGITNQNHGWSMHHAVLCETAVKGLQRK